MSDIIDSSASIRGLFSGKWGYVLAVAASAVGLGNIWRFPYYAAKYGGGTFLFVYLILLVTFGYALVIAETSIGRMTRLSAVGAYRKFTGNSHPVIKAGGWINAIVPMIILPYYCVIGGWVVRYLWAYLPFTGDVALDDKFFGSFIGSTFDAPICFLIFFLGTLLIVRKGVEAGVERASKIMMPILLILALFIAIYSMCQDGAGAGIAYYLIPDFSRFSIMTVVAACGQLFFSLSLAMAILITYGSYMKKEVDIEGATNQIGIMDTVIAVLAGFMIIPAVFAFFPDNAASTLNAGPGLMFITIPKVFAKMPLGSFVGATFFIMVLFAALTSAVSLLEACVSIVADETGHSRNVCTWIMTAEVIIIGIPCSLGFGPWSSFTLAGMDILSFLDFVSNSILMPIAAIATCLLISRVIGVDKLTAEIKSTSKFVTQPIFNIVIKWVGPVILTIIFLSSVAAALGWIKM